MLRGTGGKFVGGFEDAGQELIGGGFTFGAIEELSVSMDPSGAPGSAPAASDPTAALTDVRNQLLRLGQQIAEMRADPAASGAEAAKARRQACTKPCEMSVTS